MSRNAWLKYSAKQKKELEQFTGSYRQFISGHKTERECVKGGVAIAEAHGFTDLQKQIDAGRPVKPGEKYYLVNQGKDLVLMVIGSEPLTAGMNILGAHIDSPRLDLKQHPLYENHEIALADTHYYGGIKTYQWVTLPLALHGVVCRKDGTTVEICVGEDPDDPVVGVSDLLIHLARKQMEKKGSEVIEGEDLNVTVGSIPLAEPLDAEEKKIGQLLGERYGLGEQGRVEANLLKLIKKKYGIDKDDLMSAEIEVVPAGPARDYGLDRSMIMGYGQDDRSCAYCALSALMAVEKPRRTAVCLLVDKEEIGSVGATGMTSCFFENTVAELLHLQGHDEALAVRRALAHSKMLSTDVAAAYDPNYPDVNEMKNTAFFGHGVVINKYTGARGKSGCNDANPEFIAALRRIWDEQDVSWQSAELGKVNAGGGGTIAYIMARYNMQVIDSGVAVQNMHSPWEVTSKSDLYEAYQAYRVFLETMD
jgi:aspartyl aminopeptidase